jgi:hypothetical protein
MTKNDIERHTVGNNGKMQMDYPPAASAFDAPDAGGDTQGERESHSNLALVAVNRSWICSPAIDRRA